MKSFMRTRMAAFAAAAVLGSLTFSAAQAAPLNIKDTPLFISDSAAPLNMLVMGRDHKLYYEAYNDASDLDDDGELDTGYSPAKITYFGYFDSFKCYTYDSGAGQFNPSSTTTDKTCDGTKWSGDWLNYVTMSRMDALRKVLYGGLRTTDTTSATVLQRAYIPQDAHSWGKSYESIAINGYDINKYTPLGQPDANKSHLFANTTPLGKTRPRLFTALQQAVWRRHAAEDLALAQHRASGRGRGCGHGHLGHGNEVRTSLGTIDETDRAREGLRLRGRPGSQLPRVP